MTIHPLTTYNYARIDVCCGGNQEKIMKDTFTLTRQMIERLKKGEHVLYMNTLASAKMVEEAADAISARHAAKVLTFSESGTELTEKLAMLSLLIERKNVRMIVLNSFDFATQNTRQRVAIVQWARRMRDDHHASVVIYMLHRPSEFGAMGQLALVADSIQDTAEWRTEQPFDALERKTINTTHALEQIITEINSTPMSYPTLKNVNPSLIYNDLEVVREREEEEEEEMEYA